MRHMYNTAAALLYMAPAIAAADPTANFSGTGCTLVPVTGQAHIAEIHCKNRITAGLRTDQGAMEAKGIWIGLTVEHSPEPVTGQEPDLFVFSPDAGLTVVPAEMLVDENGSGVAFVYEWAGS